MNIKLNGVVKYGGAWKRPGDEILGVTENVGKSLIAQGLAVLLPKTQAELDAEEKKAADAKDKKDAKEAAEKEKAEAKE